jgi:ribosomal-protein-alanine N-acetyltransferase
MNKIDIVPMALSHVPEILAIEQSVFPTPWTREMFRQEIRGMLGSRPFVALAQGRVIGYRVAWYIDEDVHLVNIAVDKRHQMSGVGSLILNHLIDEALAEEMRVITLEVRAGNTAAQAFYDRFHFRTIGVRKGYYTDNREDALLMALDLETFGERREPGE